MRTLIVILLSGLLMGCPGGGDGGGSTATAQPTQIGGVVLAPSGMLAKSKPLGFFEWFATLFQSVNEAVAQGQSLAPVVNARVFLFKVDNTGSPTGAPLAMSTTGSDGTFVFNLPTGTNLSPTGSTLTVVQAALTSASVPVPIGTAGVLNVPAVQSLVMVDPGGELGTRRMIAAGISNFSSASAAGYVGLIQELLDEVPSLVGSSIATTMANIQNSNGFQNEVLPALLDIEQSAHVDQTMVDGPFSLFEYHTYADSTTAPFRRTIENGTLTFDSSKGTFLLNSAEIGGRFRKPARPFARERSHLGQ